jgi:hypothetical protein
MYSLKCAGVNAMNLRKEVLHRLLLAKSILSPARATVWGQPNPHLVARQVLTAHDAADLAFAAIAGHMGTYPAKSRAPSMIECLALIGAEGKKHAAYFTGLSNARDSLKHVGNLPNTNQWVSVGEDVFERLSEICSATLGISLDDLDETELLISENVRGYLVAAKAARASQDFKLVLEELAKALFSALEDAPSLRTIQVGRARAEDALKLTAFGVSANEFLRLQEFLPMVSAFPSGPDLQLEIEGVLWKQSKFGHPGNWRDEVADFCISTCRSVALSIQNAPPVPYPHDFSNAYEYKVTAGEDQVEVWEDLADEEKHRIEVLSDKARPSRAPKRSLKKGESVMVPRRARPFVSDDLSLSGEMIRRVRISYDPMSSMGSFFGTGPERADFVNLAQVQITCVPTELYKTWSLPEIPWEEDPLEFQL